MKPAICLLLLLCSITAAAQEKSSDARVERRQYTTQRTSQQTRFKILYDSKYLYFALHALDTSPDSIVRRMGRRDDFPGDWIEVNLDSHHDLRTAFSFTVSASGVRSEEAVSGNGAIWDASWNPIWFAKTHVDKEGWTAEIRIPLSQFRYGSEPDKVWGLQVKRFVFRKQERSTWQYIPQSSGVWVSAFGELHGLRDVPPQKQVEIAPYIVAQTARYHKVEGNPFASGSDSKISGGVDGKVAVTSDLILDFTVNPDFGQVEADLSQVRIDGFQSFFEERRPFFVESRNIFDYNLTGSAAGGATTKICCFIPVGSAAHRMAIRPLLRASTRMYRIRQPFWARQSLAEKRPAAGALAFWKALPGMSMPQLITSVNAVTCW